LPVFRGNTRAAKAVFSLPSSWLAADYRIRIECLDGCVGFDSTAFLTPDNGEVSVLLPQAWTAPGDINN